MKTKFTGISLTGSIQRSKIKLKAVLSLKIILLFIFLVQQKSLLAQKIGNKATITMMNNAYKFSKTYIKEFMEDSLVFSIKLYNSKIYIERTLPITQISCITIYSKSKSGRRALEGFLGGIAMGTIMGTALAAYGDGSSNIFHQTPSIADGIKIGISIAPISTLMGALAGVGKCKRFIIHGDADTYHHQLKEMKILLSQEDWNRNTIPD